MNSDYGIERYDELYEHFIDNIGPQGQTGYGPGIIVAKEVRQKTIGDLTTYTGFDHAVQYGELSSNSMILVYLWIYGHQLIGNATIDFIWRMFGTSFTISSAAVLASIKNGYIISISQDGSDTSQLISTSYGTLFNGTRTVQVFDGSGFPANNWIVNGGTVRIKIVTGAGNVGNILNARAYYSHVRI